MRSALNTAHILLCEDEDLLLTALDYRLRKYGFLVQRASSHEEALQQIEKALPVLVVVDLYTPRLSGLDFIATLRKNYPQLPIIAMSTQEETENLIGARLVGANDVLLKPINPTELIMRVRLQMELHKDME